MLETISSKVQHLGLDDLKNNPELITGLFTKMFFQEEDVSVVFEKRGNCLSFSYLKTYDQNTVRLLQEAKSEYVQKKAEGYTRTQAFSDLMEVLEEVHNKQP